MLSSLMSGNIINIVLTLFAHLVVLFVATPVHECSHALMAKLLGDDTAERMGRLTLNPMAHFDLLGTIGIMLFGVGWAKPVPVNVNRCYKVKSRKTAMALTAAAGPISNVLMAFIIMIISKIIIVSLGAGSGTTGVYIAYALTRVITINLYLAIFNLIIPFPPFDGSRLWLAFLPERYYFNIMKYERYIMIGILVIMWIGILDIPLSFITGLLYNLLDLATSFIC